MLLAAIAAPFLIPVDDYRPLLVSALDDATGREVQIDALKLRVFPNIRASVVNFRLRNPPGFPVGDALVAKTVDLGLNLHALLSRRLDVTSVAPSGVLVNVLRDAAGRTNFAFAPRNMSTPRSALLTLERIPPIEIPDAQVTFANVPIGKEPSFGLSGANVTIGSIDPQASNVIQKLDVFANLRGARLVSSLLAKPVEFRSGQVEFKGDGGRGSFSASLGNLDASGDVAFARLDPLSISFAAAIPQLDLNTMTDLLRSHSPATTPKTQTTLARGTVRIGKIVAGSLIATQFTGDATVLTTGLRLQKCSLSAYGGSLHGNADIDTAKLGVPVTGTVQVQGMSLQSAIAALEGDSHGVGGTLDANLSGSIVFASDPERSLEAAGTFSVRNGSLPSSQLRRFNYLGGDLHVARELGYSNALTLTAPGINATFHGSFGFDQSLSYSGVGVVNGASEIPQSSVRTMVSNMLEQHVGTTRVAVPFSLKGTFQNPQFAVAGTPTLVESQGATKSPVIPSSLQNLLQQIPHL